MDGANCNCSDLNSQTCPHYFRKREKKMSLEMNIDSLPDFILLDILVHLPAQDIYNSARFVCRKWHKMIHTRDLEYSHFHRSTCGLLIQDLCDKKSHPIVVALRRGRIETSKLSYEFRENVWSSCNGLILEPCKVYHDLYITNPETKKQVALGPFFLLAPIRSCAMAYAPISMKYKVICAVRASYWYDGNSRSTDCLILTLGVDKYWRRLLDTQHLSQTAMQLLRRWPLTTRGFVHWAHKGNVLTLNVETEMFTLVPAPLCDGERLEYYYLSAGRYLSLLIALTKFSWEVWEMKPETGEWTKLPDIDLEAQKSTFDNVSCCNLFKPVGWLNYREVLVFNVRERLFINHSRPTRLCYAYNVGTQKIETFELESGMVKFLAHRTSLVWLGES